MLASHKCLVSLNGSPNDHGLLGRRVASLRRNLEASGIRVTSIRDDGPPDENSRFETRSDPVTLATLGMTFLTSGAAVALIKALRATFDAAHSTSLKAKITIGKRSLEISGEHLTDRGAQNLEETLNKWIDDSAEGATA